MNNTVVNFKDIFPHQYLSEISDRLIKIIADFDDNCSTLYQIHDVIEVK